MNDTSPFYISHQLKLRKQNDGILSENNSKVSRVKLIEIEDIIGLSEPNPSCNDCTATIVTKQFTRTMKGIGTMCPAFRKEIRTLFLRIPESGRVSGVKINIILANF